MVCPPEPAVVDNGIDGPICVAWRIWPCPLSSCKTCGKGECGDGSALKKCSRCQSVAYCGGDCQKSDWKSHKPNCKPVSGNNNNPNNNAQAETAKIKQQLAQFVNEIVKINKPEVEFLLHAFLEVPTFTMGYANARRHQPDLVVEGEEPDYLETNVPAVNIYLHGGLAHSGHAYTIADALLPLNIPTYSFDLRGFGHWEGIPGHVESGPLYLKDIESFVDFVQKRHKNSPLILSGHSMGGMLLLAYLGEHQKQFKCAVVCAPWLKNKIPLNFVLHAASGVVNKLYPSFSQPPAFSLEVLTHDKNIIEQHKRDRQIYKKSTATVRFYVESLQLQQVAIEQTKKIELPIIVFFGGKDQLADENVAKAAFEGMPSKDKTWHYYPDFFHEVWFEEGREDSLKKVAEFVAKNI